MFDVRSDRIVYVPDGVSAYRFRVAGPLVSGTVRIVDLSDPVFPEDETLAALLEAVPKDGILHVQGISLASSLVRIRRFYESLGYFEAGTNRFRVPFGNVPVTFGADVGDVGCAGFPPPKGTYAAKAVRSGFNSGLLCHLRLQMPSERSNGKKKVRTPRQAVSELLFSEGMPPFSLGRALYFNAVERGIVADFEEWTITMPDSRS